MCFSHPAAVYGSMSAEEVTQRILETAGSTGLVLLVGLVEPAGEGKPYLSQLVAGPGGLIGIHRKSHLSPAEREAYRAGESIGVYTHRGTRFGIQLCYESHFPEISTVMALSGAEVLFMPHASPRGTARGKRASWLRHLPARAFDNGVFVVACNQHGKQPGGMSFPGLALVIGPDGHLMEQFTGDADRVVTALLGREFREEIREHRMRYFLPFRRPELYRQIAGGRRGNESPLAGTKEKKGTGDSDPPCPAVQKGPRPD